YAVRAADTYQAREDRPVHLALMGSVQAGKDPDIHLGIGEAAEIATGAVMPSGADAVVMVEYTRTDAGLQVLRPVSINENVMHAGSDIMTGERVMKKGTIPSSREAGVLAAVGRSTVRAFALKACLISTGNELEEPGRKLGSGMIYDINSCSIYSAVKECGGIPIRCGIVKDDKLLMKNTLKKAAETCDIILTSGSTSAGSGDIMYRIIEEEGTVLAHGIDIKPGKPAIIGKIYGKPFFGLPGYPASALSIFNEFIAPVIREITGHAGERTTVKAKMASRVRSDGRNQLLPVGLARGLAYPVEKGSGAITALSEANGFIEIPGSVEMIDAGEEVEVTLFGKPESYDLVFVGSHCLGLDTLLDIMNLKMRVIIAGSSGGLSAIRRGTADIAGVHLLDESGIYNVPFLKRFGVKNAAIVKGYLREQGLIVREKSSIERFEDIIDARIINRNTGSGTRTLMDLKLMEVARKMGKSFEDLASSIDGYHTEAKTHSAVAAAVKLGKADAGIGIRTVAEMNGLKFIKIADEEYDFVIPTKLLGTGEIEIFLNALRSKEFGEKLPPGLKTYERTGEISLH
ncbi:MAG TPA: molybdopterin biosynthesis protein, partial [Candidatus Methanoperedens sp.]